MNYKDNYSQRKREIAVDVAKHHFYKHKNFVRSFGFNTDEEIPIHTFMKFPRVIRKMPDFMYVDQGKFYFSEVKGCHDILRLKIEDIKDYYWWHVNVKEATVMLFIYSTKLDKFIEISLEHVCDLIKKNKEVYKFKKYPDNNKKYVEIPIEDIFV